MTPTVSICVTAYNIQEYIAECLDSILAQRVNFSYEIVIGEDCSTDDTRRILNDYGQRYPDVIRVIYNANNLGMMPNFVATIEACRGEFIAVMDGDDKWIDENKLQVQVDFLRQNHDYALCFHDAHICDAQLNPVQTYSARYPERYDSYMRKELILEDIVQWRGILGATSSIVFRRYFDKFPSWVKSLYGLEPMLFILLIGYGRYKYFPQVMSSYRVHSKSTDRSFSQIAKSKRDISEYYVYLDHFYPKFSRYFTRKIIRNRSYLVYKYLTSASLKDIPSTFVKLTAEAFRYLKTFVPIGRS